jgi:SAM-dependent methyltransferase
VRFTSTAASTVTRCNLWVSDWECRTCLRFLRRGDDAELTNPAMLILNLGCGSKTSPDPKVVNIDWSILLRIRSNPLLRRFAPLLLNGYRLERFKAMPDNLMVHDIARGIPFADSSVDMVYHSHVLEHLDRGVASQFIRECARVLKPGGLIRIVVPDFERYCRNYLDHVALCEVEGASAIEQHDSLLEPLLSMSVRREAFGSSQQRPVRRFIENLLLGDARRRGQTHQWMYDRFNLTALLIDGGFLETKVQRFDTSGMEGWAGLGLDVNDVGGEYKPESLYMEARRSSLGTKG